MSPDERCWVPSNRGDAPAGPVAVTVRDPQVWWTAETLRERLDGLAKAHPKQVTLRAGGGAEHG